MTDHNLKKENNMGMLHRIVVLVVTVLIAGVVAQSQDVPSNAAYKNPKLPVEQRVQDLLGRMTLEEKAGMLSGANWMESVVGPTDSLLCDCAHLAIPGIEKHLLAPAITWAGWPVPDWLALGIVAVMGLAMMGVGIAEFRKTE